MVEQYPLWYCLAVPDGSLPSSLVRLLNAAGDMAGFGVVVGKREIVTCAHVVNTALGRDLRATDKPDEPVLLDFPASSAGPLRGYVRQWTPPPPREGLAGDDIACLDLTEDVPADVEPARLITTLPGPGHEVELFGPDRLRALVGEEAGGRLALDSAARPGFSGGPVWDPATRRVVGIVVSTGDTPFAITADRLRLAWPRALDPRLQPGRHRAQRGVDQVTVLHLSNTRFGGGEPDAWFSHLHADLDQLAQHDGLRPDLVVVAGDLTEQGLRTEFERAGRFLRELAEAAELTRDRVAVVPGNHDVNRLACQAYFLQQTAEEREPIAPYWPKWNQFHAAFTEFYRGVRVDFTPDEPWTLFEVPGLNVVVAGLNSTMAASHLEVDHPDELGETQLLRFAGRLDDYRKLGWLRLGLVHRATPDIDDLLGRRDRLNLLLRGRTPTGHAERISSGLLALPSGISGEPPGYQVLTINAGGVTRHTRQYERAQRRWIGDTRVDWRGADWHTHVLAAWGSVTRTFTVDQPRREERDPAPVEDTFFQRIQVATGICHPNATVTPYREKGYLRVSKPREGGGFEQWPVQVADGPVTRSTIERFAAGVHATFTAADPAVPSELVYNGPPASADLVAAARHYGIRLRSFVDYQGLLDLRPLVDGQRERLATDQIYPADLYVPQRFRVVTRQGVSDPADAMLHQVVDWLDTDHARFVMVLGDFGRGKSFLLRQLARELPGLRPALLPVLVELRSLEKAPTLDELLAQHLVREGVEAIDLPKLRFMISSGRLALFFDGFDELELRVGYDNAADYLRTLLQAVTDRAKVVLTSRSQHFRSTNQVLTALGEHVATLSASRVAVLEDFTDDQILLFLTHHYAGDAAKAKRRFDLLGDIHDLLGLSQNPRMLSFIADLDEERLREVQRQHGQISAAELYRELVDFWLIHEADRQRHRSGMRSLDDKERLSACTALALRLWHTTASTIKSADLADAVAETLTKLAERGYSTDQAAHAVGSGTLLVRTEEGGFSFVHQSVMEWLVAHAAAEQVKEGKLDISIAYRTMSPLMIDFLSDLAGHDRARSWAEELTAPATAREVKQNALAILQRLGSTRRLDLAGVDLRSTNLLELRLRNALLAKADLRGQRLTNAMLTGADLSGADLSGIRMTGGDLTGATLTGSRWDRAALLGVEGLAGQPELESAAVSGRDRAEVMLAAGGWIGAVAYSPSGDLIAVARGWDVEVLDAKTKQVLRLLRGHAGPVTGVAFTPDGAHLATGSADHTARIWHVATGTTTTTFDGHTGGVVSIALSPDGTRLATGSKDRTARIWDTATGTTTNTLYDHIKSVVCVAFSPDGERLAAISQETSVRLWDIAAGITTTFEGHNGRVNAVAFSPDGTHIATASNLGNARIWDAVTGITTTVLEGHTDRVNTVAFSPDGTHIATGSDDCTARIWHVDTGVALATLEDPTTSVVGVVFAPDDPQIAVVAAHGMAWLWNTTSDSAPAITSEPHRVNAVAFSPDGTSVLTGSHDGIARIWGTETYVNYHSRPVTSVAFSPDGTRIATASRNDAALIWRGTTTTTLIGHVDWVNAIVFSPDGTRIATASSDHTARIWDTATRTTITVHEGHADSLMSVAFSPDGTRIATASRDHTARIWHGDASTELAGHAHWVNAVAFSPDGTRIATASSDHTARIWDTATGTTLSTLEGHTDWLNAVAYSPDGTLLATAADDGTARLWDTTGRERTTLIGHSHRVTSVAFSPDGRHVVTGAMDDTARIWDTASGATLATLVNLEVGSAILLPDGSYKLSGDPGDKLWWAIKLCRFAPGELDPYYPEIRRLPDDAPIPGLATR
jgi:WD40 repeat protein/3',5'-cyclic AMP phosphodiesterase CpdA